MENHSPTRNVDPKSHSDECRPTVPLEAHVDPQSQWSLTSALSDVKGQLYALQREATVPVDLEVGWVRTKWEEDKFLSLTGIDNRLSRLKSSLYRDPIKYLSVQNGFKGVRLAPRIFNVGAGAEPDDILICLVLKIDIK
jgi:hypothetical protein